MVDTTDSKSVARKGVGVQVPPEAPVKIHKLEKSLEILEAFFIFGGDLNRESGSIKGRLNKERFYDVSRTRCPT